MPKSILIIGAGIVGAFATRAALDNFPDAEVLVASAKGSLEIPPPGAFYLHQLPGVYDQAPRPYNHHEVRWGNDPEWYGMLLGPVTGLSPERRETSAHRLPKERVLGVWQPTETLMSSMFLGAKVYKELIPTSALPEVSAIFDAVIQTVNLPHVQGRTPKLGLEYVSIVPKGKLGASLKLLGDDSFYTFSEVAHRTDHHKQSFTFYNCSGRGRWRRITHLQNNEFFAIETRAEDAELLSRVLGVDHKAVPKFAMNHHVRNESVYDNVLLTGRWATWDRKELSHETYHKTENFLRRVL